MGGGLAMGRNLVVISRKRLKSSWPVVLLSVVSFRLTAWDIDPGLVKNAGCEEAKNRRVIYI